MEPAFIALQAAPNSYFQPPGADGRLRRWTCAPVNVLGFAPQTPESGSLSIGKLVIE